MAEKTTTKSKKVIKLEVLKTLYNNGEFTFPGEVVEYKGTQENLKRMIEQGLVALL